ncbi:MAG: hypothetical protein Q7T53_08885 [Deltaproteobacteria bacterium]|nr:hypothetical protein [Deltaproteobacteria bacterium]
MAEILSKASKKKFLLSLKGPFPILVPIIITGIMLYVTGLIPEIGKWYSFNQSLRLQTDAFLRGELALNPVPYGHSGDWAWGNGMHQLWGLGVPIIRLPFEILGKAFGSFGFPDRIVFAIVYFLVAAIFWKSLDSLINTDLSIRDQFKKRVKNIPILVFGLLNPAFITMVRARFDSYEEVIAYSYLWALMLFALLLLFLNNHKSRLFFLICFLAGFSPNLRPTAISYGAVTLLMIFYLAKDRQIKFRWLGLLLFSAGIIFLLVTNYLRFNSPIEFGHNLLLSGYPIQDYIMKFDDSFARMPILNAGSELFSDLFFTDLDIPYFLDERLLTGSGFPRIREFYFRPYDSLTPFLLFLSWVIVAVGLINKSSFSSSLDKKVIQMSGLWSFCSFVMLFYFYSRFPVFSSRYFVDFGASIVIGIIALYFYIGRLVQYKFSKNISYVLNLILSAVFLGWSLFSLTHAKINPRHWHRSEIRKTICITAEVAQKELTQMRQTTDPLLPVEYKCRDQESKYGIPFNNRGWDITDSCMVNPVTTHFLDSPECLAIHVEPVGGVPEWMRKIYSDEEIEVKAGLKKMQRISDEKSEFGKIITFCLNRKDMEENKGRQIELISIKWGDLQKHPNMPTPPLRLSRLSKVENPKH